MRRREFLAIGLASATLGAAAARAQPTARIGLIGIGSADSGKFVVDALRQGLRELGYREGSNLIVLERCANGDPTEDR
jgi:Fe2+ transport system protein FeoA